MNHDARPRHVDATVKREEAWRGFKDHIRRDVQSHHRRYGDAHLTALRGNTGAPVVELAPVRVAAQIDLPLLRQYRSAQRRAHAVEVHRDLARLHVKRHKVAVNIHAAEAQLAEQLRALRIARQAQVGVHHALGFFPACENRVHHRQVEVADSDVAAQISPSLWVGNLNLAVKLTVVGETNQPAQLRTVVMQVCAQVQGVEGHRQRRVIYLLRHLHVTPGQRDATLRQPLFGGVPGDIGFSAEDAAGLGSIRHKRFQHRQIEAVEVDLRASFRARVDGLRHAQFRIRVGPAVRPNADLLLGVAVVQRDGARQRQRPDRRVEAGVIQRPFPALLFAVKAAGQVKLAGDRLALHAQLEIVLLLVPFGVQGHQVNVDVRLRNALHAQVQVSADLVSGFHIPFHTNAGNAQRLPAQVIGGNVRQQLRRVYRAAHLQEPLRRTAQARQGVIQIRRVDGGVQIEIFHPQLAFDIRRVAAQRHVQPWDNPLQIAVAFHRAFNVNLVLLHVPGELDFRYVHLPGAAVQAAAGFNQAVQF